MEFHQEVAKLKKISLSYCLCNSKIDRTSFSSLYHSSLEKDKLFVNKVFEQIDDENIEYSIYKKVSHKPIRIKSSNKKITREGTGEMLLSFEQKRQILGSFSELTEENMSNGRVNYKFYGSNRQSKTIARELKEIIQKVIESFR